jgi:hypothetical protein
VAREEGYFILLTTFFFSPVYMYALIAYFFLSNSLCLLRTCEVVNLYAFLSEAERQLIVLTHTYLIYVHTVSSHHVIVHSLLDTSGQFVSIEMCSLPLFVDGRDVAWAR